MVFLECREFVQIVVEVISTLTKRGVMPFVWVVGLFLRTTLSSLKFSFKRIALVELVPSVNSFRQRETKQELDWDLGFVMVLGKSPGQ